jgi:hypothetical protein
MREPRAALRCWGALLHELREALFELARRRRRRRQARLVGGGDAGDRAGRARHPLGERWRPAGAQGRALDRAGAGAGRWRRRARAADTAQALAALRPLAQARWRWRTPCSATRAGATRPTRSPCTGCCIALPRGPGREDGARLPMHLLARQKD